MDELETLYRRPNCHEGPNPYCGKCDLGKMGICEVYSAYMRLKEKLELLEILKKDSYFYKECIVPNKEFYYLNDREIDAETYKRLEELMSYEKKRRH